MIALMEAAAVATIAPYMPEGKASVGIELHIQHLSATPIGEQVVAMAEITAIEGKRIQLEVRAWDETELIGVGTHLRYIIDVDEFMERVRGEGETE